MTPQTLVYLHAHPDDEASQTSGSMARAAAEGHRVVLVFATNGEHGEVPDDLADGETLVDRRRAEAQASAAVLGVARVAWLGYTDSGMTGWAQNDHPGSFLQADLDEAAGRVAEIVDEEGASVLVGYDWHGGYGHPDHVKVHEVARRAADLVSGPRPRVLDATMNRDLLRAIQKQAVAAGMAAGDWDPDAPFDDGQPLGTPEAEITWQGDVSAYVAQRRASLECHRSQTTDIQGFLAIPEEAFALLFSLEHYVEPGLPGPMRRAWFLD